jgi:hypothetical protein
MCFLLYIAGHSLPVAELFGIYPPTPPITWYLVTSHGLCITSHTGFRNQKSEKWQTRWQCVRRAKTILYFSHFLWSSELEIIEKDTFMWTRYEWLEKSSIFIVFRCLFNYFLNDCSVLKQVFLFFFRFKRFQENVASVYKYETLEYYLVGNVGNYSNDVFLDDCFNKDFCLSKTKVRHFRWKAEVFQFEINMQTCVTSEFLLIYICEMHHGQIWIVLMAKERI